MTALEKIGVALASLYRPPDQNDPAANVRFVEAAERSVAASEHLTEVARVAREASLADALDDLARNR